MYRRVMHYLFYGVRTFLYTIFFVNISFVAFFLGLGELGAENRTSLSSKQSILKNYHTKEFLFAHAINNLTVVVFLAGQKVMLAIC